MTYQEFITLIDQTSNNLNWRYGQALMNVLYSVWPEKYNEITQSGDDPYYREDQIGQTLKSLKENWKPTNDKL